MTFIKDVLLYCIEEIKTLHDQKDFVGTFAAALTGLVTPIWRMGDACVNKFWRSGDKFEIRLWRGGDSAVVLLRGI